MSKRLSSSGNSPAFKKLPLCQPSAKGDSCELSSLPVLNVDKSDDPGGSCPLFSHFSFTKSQQSDSFEELRHIDHKLFTFDANTSSSSPCDYNRILSLSSTPTQLSDILVEHVEEKGLEAVAECILQQENLKQELLKQLLKESHTSLKTSLKNSILCASKKDRDFLLKISPRSLCEEFKALSPMTFALVAKGLFGISNEEEIFSSQHILNNIACLLSTVSKAINRKATSYAYLMTNAVRDGGLREDSIKLFPMLIHPRTSQIYDKERF